MITSTQAGPSFSSF